MRTTKLLATILVAGLLTSACQQDPDYVLPAIRVASETLNFNADTEQPLEFTATRDWRVRSKPTWVTVTPDQGSGSEAAQRVRVTVTDNPDYNREGEVVLSIGLAKATVAISQPGAKGEVPVGSGTLEDPYTITGVLRYIATLSADVNSPAEVYITGKVASVDDPYGAQYGSGTFKIKDATGDETFQVYRAYYLGNKKWTENDPQIKVGDDVVVCGLVVNYKGNTPETVQNKAYLYSHNGVTESSGGSGGGETTGPKGTGTLADPYNAAAVNAYIETLADNAKSDSDVYVAGKISKIANNGTFGSYGNATFYISDDGKTGGTDFYCYRVLYLGNKEWKEGDTQIQVGDDVIICGKVTKYVKDGKSTLETVQKEAYVYSLNGKTE